MNNKDADYSHILRHYAFSKHRYRVICSHYLRDFSLSFSQLRIVDSVKPK